MSDENTVNPAQDPLRNRPGHFDRFGIDNQASVTVELDFVDPLGCVDSRFPKEGPAGVFVGPGGNYVKHLVWPDVANDCQPSRVECIVKVPGHNDLHMAIDAPDGQFVLQVDFIVTSETAGHAVGVFA